MLQPASRQWESRSERGEDHHVQLVCVLERPAAGLAVVPVVALGFHVLHSVAGSVELLGAGLAGDFGRPVVQSAHMLVCGVLRGKVPGAGLAVEARGPVVEGVHVLVAGLVASKAPVAGLALILGFGGAGARVARRVIRVRRIHGD